MELGTVADGRPAEGRLAEGPVRGTDGAGFTPGTSTSTVPGPPGVPAGMKVVVASVMVATVCVVVTLGGS